MQKARELLALVLVTLLPFHALLVTVGTKLIVGPNPPLTELALWKEAVLGLILLLACIEWARKPAFKLDAIDWLVGSLVLLSVLVTALTHADWKLYLFGFKYDFIPLIAFFVLRRVEWSELFRRHTQKLLVGIGIGVSLYAVVSLWLPANFFHSLGYSDLHSLYNPDGPLAAFQQIDGMPIRRAQSTFSGPNQFGLWLLIPFSIALTQGALVTAFVIALGMLLSMSRAAVLGACLIAAVFSVQKCTKKTLITLAALLLVLFMVALHVAPNILLRATSTANHIERPLEAARIIKKNPFGLGLGMAGPASNRVSDTCVHLPAGSDAAWATDRPSLCVFVGEEQVQPELPCSCPLLPENWYLQVGVEMGVLGFVLFVSLVVMVLAKLPKKHPVWYAFLGVSIAALFLHAWEDSAVAYTLWLLLATL